MSLTHPSISDYLYSLRDEAGIAADKLRAAITEANEKLAKLDAIADGAERAAELVAASDLQPDSHATIPPESGLMYSNAADALNADWRSDGHPHMRDKDGTCTNCGAVEGERHYKLTPLKPLSVARIYRDLGDAAQGALHTENGIEYRRWRYGVKLTGRSYDRAELMDPPQDEQDNAWLEQELSTRMNPGGEIIHRYKEPYP